MAKTALVADWLVTFGGAEHVLQEFCMLFPDAPLFTTVAKKERLGPLQTRDIRTGSLQWIYELVGRHEPLLPFFPRAVEKIDLTGFDLIISSSHAVGKGIIPPSTARHICYCHTPIRYAWEMQEQYLEDFKIPHRLRPTIRRMLSRLKRWDLSTAKRVDTFIANSKTTQERISRIYSRDSIVLPPPVSDVFFHTPLQKNPSDYFLGIGRQVPYKRFDLLIDVANKTGMKLKLAGTGSDHERLKKLAGPTVELLGRVPEAELPSLYANAKALLFPQEEDAGIVLLEAHAAGTPAIAFRRGGALDAIIEKETGIFFDAQTPESLTKALDAFSQEIFNREKIRTHAMQFSRENFLRTFNAIVDQEIQKIRV